MTEQEKIDLAELHAATANIKLACVDYQIFVSKMSDADLKHSGLKTREQGYASSLARAQNQLDALMKAHLKKYPD